MDLSKIMSSHYPDDVCESCNTSSLRISRSIIHYENDDTPDMMTQGYTVAIISCVNPNCNEFNRPKFGGAEPMGTESKVLFCECGQLIYETSNNETVYSSGVELKGINGTTYAVCECSKEHKVTTQSLEI